MTKKKSRFVGIKKPISSEAVKKLKIDLEKSSEQTKRDSKIDNNILNAEFNS